MGETLRGPGWTRWRWVELVTIGDESHGEEGRAVVIGAEALHRVFPVKLN